MKETFLVLYAGTGTVRSLICDQSGAVLGSAYANWEHQAEPLIPGGMRFDAAQLMDTLVELCHQALGNSGLNSKDVRAISVASIREGVIFMDSGGQVLYSGPGFDARARPQGEQLAAEMGMELYYTSGTYPPTYGIPARLRWFASQQPDLYERINKVLTTGSWLVYELCGEVSDEPAQGSSTGLFDVVRCDWSWDLVDRFQIPRQWLPPIIWAGSQVGGLKKEMAARLGLKPDLPVIIGGGDTHCAMLGMGLSKAKETGCVAGSTSPVQQLTSQPVFDNRMRTWTSCFLREGLWSLESSAIVTGMSVKWLREQMGQGMTFDQINSMAEATPPGSRGVRAFLGAELMDITRYRQTWTGGLIFPVPPAGFGMAEVFRASYESNAYAVRANINQLEHISGNKACELHVGGGQTASRVAMNILADVLGRPILVHPTDTAALGAAICASVGSRVYANFDEAILHMVHRPRRVEPRAKEHQAYEELYQNWMALYTNMKGLDFEERKLDES